MWIEDFQEFRKILCVCPDCGKIVRLSDLHIKSKTEVENTWLDYYDYRERILCDREAEFNAVSNKLRQEAVIEGRRQADLVFNKAIKQDFKQMNYDPSDIKPVLNPVDFLVFNGMNKCNCIEELVFLAKHINNPLIKQLRTQLQESITNKNYEWLVARIDEEGKIEFE